VNNDPDSIDGLIARLRDIGADHGDITVAIDLMGGIASLLTAMLTEENIHLVHVPGLVVNRARRATKGGEAKSDPRDAKTIADQLRLRDDWREVTTEDETTLDLRILASRRRDLVVDQTRRLQRLRETLTSIFPGLERAVDVTINRRTSQSNSFSSVHFTVVESRPTAPGATLPATSTGSRPEPRIDPTGTPAPLAPATHPPASPSHRLTDRPTTRSNAVRQPAIRHVSESLPIREARSSPWVDRRRAPIHH
jgi:hypothetical protein